MRKLIASMLLAAATPAAAYTPSGMVFFGDSFIDAGAVNQFTGGAIAPAELGFFEGRFSDGPTWADIISRRNLGNTVKTFYTGNPPGSIPGLPGFVYTPGASNFAVGGARGGSDDGLIPGLPSQVGLYFQYLGATGDIPDADTLFVLNFGNNDVNYIQSLAGDPAAQEAAFEAYVTNMASVVSFLETAGAQHILVAGVPNPTEAEGVALQAALDGALDLVEADPGFTANLYRFDYFGFFTTLVADPTVYGLPATLVTDPNRFCLAEVVPMPGIDCSNYLSFDGIHVTGGVQRAIAFEIEALVGLRGAVPEPATWGLMIAGFGLTGFALRRSRASAPA
jgi:phospholipase/lecithinase/hemolysin